VRQDRLLPRRCACRRVILLLGARLVERGRAAPSVLDHLGAGCEAELPTDHPSTRRKLEPLQASTLAGPRAPASSCRNLGTAPWSGYGAALESDRPPGPVCRRPDRPAQGPGAPVSMARIRAGPDWHGVTQLRFACWPRGEAQTLASLETAEAAARSRGGIGLPALLSTRAQRGGPSSWRSN